MARYVTNDLQFPLGTTASLQCVQANVEQPIPTGDNFASAAPLESLSPELRTPAAVALAVMSYASRHHAETAVSLAAGDAAATPAPETSSTAGIPTGAVETLAAIAAEELAKAAFKAKDSDHAAATPAISSAGGVPAGAVDVLISAAAGLKGEAASKSPGSATPAPTESATPSSVLKDVEFWVRADWSRIIDMFDGESTASPAPTKTHKAIPTHDLPWEGCGPCDGNILTTACCTDDSFTPGIAPLPDSARLGVAGKEKRSEPSDEAREAINIPHLEADIAKTAQSLVDQIAAINAAWEDAASPNPEGTLSQNTVALLKQATCEILLHDIHTAEETGIDAIANGPMPPSVPDFLARISKKFAGDALAVTQHDKREDGSRANGYWPVISWPPLPSLRDEKCIASEVEKGVDVAMAETICSLVLPAAASKGALEERDDVEHDATTSRYPDYENCVQQMTDQGKSAEVTA